MEYYWIKWLHYIAFVSWMAFLFYQPRLYVYHAENLDNENFVKIVKIQERKMFNFIGYPAVVITFLTGISMILMNSSLMKMPHIHLKLTLVVLMLFFHIYLGICLKNFEKNCCKKSGKFFRILNEIPTILLLVIIFSMIIMPIL